MKIPRAFKIKGKIYRVEFEKDLYAEDNFKCDGLCDLERKIIYLDKSLKGKQKTSVFLHELFHALVHEAHINPGVRFSEGIEEVLCDAFSDLLITSFTNFKWKN